MNFTVSPLAPDFAAEVTGLDCAKPLDAETFRAVKEAYLRYPVLVFRDQVLSARELAVFGRRFGKLESYGQPTVSPALREAGARATPDQMLYLSPEDPDVLIMTNEIRANLPVVGVVDNAETWHSDASHQAEPCQAVAVHVVRNPASGGDTEFCDMRAVYDALPESVKADFNGRLATHHWSKSRNRLFDGRLAPAEIAKGEEIARLVPPLGQPLVRSHPETGRPFLYISPRFTLGIEGLEKAVSDKTLEGLFALAEEPRFHYRHNWREKDLMIWDNRCLNHRVCAYEASDIRCRHRVTVTGDRPFYRAG